MATSKVETHRTFTRSTGTEVQGYYLDEYLRCNLELLKKRVKNKYDGCLLLTGGEGSGKSTLAQTIGDYLNPGNLKVENIVFSGKDLLKRINCCKPFEVLIYDESITDISSSDHSNEIHKTLIKVFTMMRSKQFYIIIILPNIFQLRRYFSITRSLFLVHTFSKTGYDRGYFKFYSFKRKKQMILKGNKNWDMNVVRPNFSRRFINTEGFFIDQEVYEAKKQEAIRQISGESESEIDKIKETYSVQLEELKARVKDYKSKLKDQYKDKYQRLSDKYTKRYTKLKDVYKDGLKKHKKDTESLAKYEKLCKYYDKLLYWSFLREKELYERANIDKELSEKAYATLLKENKVIDTDYRSLKKNLDAGKTLVDLQI